MAISLQDLISGKAKLPKLGSAYVCVKCGADCDIDSMARHNTKDGLLCDDCYFEAMGIEVEKHPIGHPGIRRGHSSVGRADALQA